jgi:asparagine synthase (glutamine-hydrolysing)
VRELLDDKALATALRPDADPQTARLGTEMVLDLDSWLRKYQVTLNL